MTKKSDNSKTVNPHTDHPVSDRIQQLMREGIIKDFHVNVKPPTLAEASDRFRGCFDQAYKIHSVPDKVTSTHTAVESPNHYTVSEKFELIDVLCAHPHLGGNRQQAIQYIYRADLKGSTIYDCPEDLNRRIIEDLEKAIKFLKFEIRRLKGEPVSDTMRRTHGGSK